MPYYRDLNGLPRIIDTYDHSRHLPDGCVEITKAEFDALAVAPSYAEVRAKMYAAKPLQDQLDMQYWDAVNGTTLWRTWIAGIKAAVPKV